MRMFHTRDTLKVNEKGHLEIGGADCTVADMHSHFYCERCRRTFCLPCEQVPIVPLPEGFLLQGVNYVLKGLCSDCRAKAGAE